MPSPTPSPTRDATPTRRGLMGVTAQTFSGVKTFLDAIKLALKPTVDLPTGGAELEGHILYDSTLKRPQVHDGTAWKSVVMATSGTDATSLEEHLTSASAHAAASITYGDTDVGTALDGKVSSGDLSSGGGTAMVGAPASAAGPAPESFTAGTTRTQLDSILGWVNARARKAAAETISALWEFTGGLKVGGGPLDLVAGGALTDLLPLLKTPAPATGDRRLLWEVATGDGAVKVRFYAFTTGGVIITVNARWDSSVSKWFPDTVSTGSTRFSFNTVNMTVRTFTDGTGAGFTDANFSSTLIELNPNNLVKGYIMGVTAAGTAAFSTPEAIGGSMIRARGIITTNGSGGAVVSGAFNITGAVADASGLLLVNFAGGTFTDGNYVPIYGAGDNGLIPNTYSTSASQLVVGGWEVIGNTLAHYQTSARKVYITISGD